MDLRPCSPTIWKTLEKTGPTLGRKEGLGTPHSSSYTGTPGTESVLFPDDSPRGHRTCWGRRGAAGAELPREARGRGRSRGAQ